MVGLGATTAPLFSHQQPANQTFDAPLEPEHFCAGVVHPKTKETITKYHKILKDSDEQFRATWIKAMCIELGRLAQGYKDTKGTNTIKFLTPDEIRHIPNDRTVTYARIVVDYRPHRRKTQIVFALLLEEISLITLTNCQPAQQISQLPKSCGIASSALQVPDTSHLT